MLVTSTCEVSSPSFPDFIAMLLDQRFTGFQL